MDLDKITKVDGKYIETKEISAEKVQEKLDSLIRLKEGLLLSKVNDAIDIDRQVAGVEIDIAKIIELQK